MNYHDWKHHASCFKYGQECRGPLPRQCDGNRKFEGDKDEDGKCTPWRSLLKDEIAVYLFIQLSNQNICLLASK
jgi:hypothetical protein